MGRERKIARLREYDYRQNGVYVVTICVHERRMAFGKINDGVVQLHRFGEVAQEHWLAIPQHFPQVQIDEFVIMPNHIHGILWVEGEKPPTPQQEVQLRQFGKPQSGSLSTIIGAYKGSVSRKIGELRGSRTRVWQERFFDHVIRNDADLHHHREYIQSNPSKWLEDEFYSQPQK